MAQKGTTELIKGLSFVAPPAKFDRDPFIDIKAVEAEWIAVIPYAFSSLGETHVKYNVKPWQWWGERTEGVKHTIDQAHENGLRVMLKPQVYIGGSWPGDLDFDREEDWQLWETNYTTYILEMANIAAEKDIDLFCIGTEFVKSVQLREGFWRKLITQVRDIYCGPLTYSSNWDNYTSIPFWDALDFIGISSYFPLSPEKTPSKSTLENAWGPIVDQLESFHQKMRKPILFTEFGYLSVDQCAWKTWELEKKVKSLDVNEKGQAVALDAFFNVFWDQDWFAGGFLWKWFPNFQGHEGYIERDYTPQKKMAEQILKNWYSK